MNRAMPSAPSSRATSSNASRDASAPEPRLRARRVPGKAQAAILSVGEQDDGFSSRASPKQFARGVENGFDKSSTPRNFPRGPDTSTRWRGPAACGWWKMAAADAPRRKRKRRRSHPRATGFRRARARPRAFPPVRDICWGSHRSPARCWPAWRRHRTTQISCATPSSKRRKLSCVRPRTCVPSGAVTVQATCTRVTRERMAPAPAAEEESFCGGMQFTGDRIAFERRAVTQRLRTRKFLRFRRCGRLRRRAAGMRASLRAEQSGQRARRRPANRRLRNTTQYAG